MKSLDDALDCGLAEKDFWNMSFDEVVRFKSSYQRRKEAEIKETLNYIYIMGNLVGISNARLHNKSASYPAIETLFPQFFKPEDAVKSNNQTNISVQRFLLFANSHNKKYKEGKK